MRVLLFNLVLLFFAGRVCFAQETLKIEKASREYDVVIQVQACGGKEQRDDSNTCSGPARVSLYKKHAESPFQVLHLPNIELYKDTAAFNPQTSEKPRGIYAEEYSVVFDDFNFDGKQDLAICNGRGGGYGSPSYNVYLFNKRLHKFIANRRLSRLTEDVYLGLFFPDAKKKLLIAFWKSGCCYHETEKYRVVNNRPVLIERIIEDATVGNGKFAKVTTRRLINGKWVTRVTREKINTDEP